MSPKEKVIDAQELARFIEKTRTGAGAIYIRFQIANKTTETGLLIAPTGRAFVNVIAF